jgi:predicted mannosyl-3-phosphoglycerate phosphatase (HAD superfamily)
VIGFLVTYLLRFIPIGPLYVYKTPIQIVSVLLIMLGTYMSGAISNEEAWQARVKEMEVKVAEAEAKAAKENVKIVEKIIVKTEVVREKGNEIIKYVDREIVKFDSKCEIPKEVVNVVNKAAEGAK